MAFWQFAILLVVVNSAIWVQFDAANLRDRYQIGVGPRGWPPHRWSALVFLVWPVALPLYLRARDAATLEDPRTGPPPRFVNGALDSFAIGVGLAGLGLFAILLVYGHLYPSLLGLVIAVAGVFGGRRCRMTGETERVELGEIGFDQKGFSAPPSPVPGEEDDGPPPQDIEKYFAQMGRPVDRPAENRPAPSAPPPSSAPSSSAPVGVPYDPPPGVPYEPPSTPPTGETPPAAAPPPPPPPQAPPRQQPQPVDEARATPPAARAKSAPTDSAQGDDLLGFALEDDEPATPNVPPVSSPVSSPSPSRPAASPPAAPPPARPAARPPREAPRPEAPPQEAPRQEAPRSAPPPAARPASAQPAPAPRPAPSRPNAPRPAAPRPGAPRPAAASLGYGAAKAKSSSFAKIAGILAVVAVVVLAGWGAWAWWSASSSEDPVAAGPDPEPSTAPVAEAPADEPPTAPGSERGGAAASAQPVEDYVIQPWLSRYADVMRPLGSALDEVDFGGLEEARCKALAVALRRAKALEPAPDPQLDQALRPAFDELDAALAACLSGNEDLWAIQLLQAKESTHETQVLMDERYGYGGVLELELESAIGVDRSRESISGRFLEKEKEAELGF